MKTAAIIPARMGSTRFPGKVLANLGGKPIVQWVWERTKASKADEVIIASDSEEVIRAVKAFGGNAQMTSPNHPSGSDRIWEVAAKLDCDIIINVQGDEPFVEPTVIDRLIDVMQASPAPDMATVVVPATREQIGNNPNSPKVVIDVNDYALYFSRSPIPFLRTGGTEMPLYRHWGIYAYSRSALKKFVSLPESPLEKCEKLEQLRALENGMKIKVIKTEFQSIGIDTPEDLESAEKYLQDHMI